MGIWHEEEKQIISKVIGVEGSSGEIIQSQTQDSTHSDNGGDYT